MNVDIPACATPGERAYLDGVAVDTSADSYKYNRAVLLAQVRERQRQADDRVRLHQGRLDDLRERLRHAPDDVVLHWEHIQVIAAIENVTLKPLTAQERRDFNCSGYSIASERLAVFPVPPRSLAEVHAGYEEVAHVLCGPCPKRDGHRGERTAYRTWLCLACEREGQEKALTLIPCVSAPMQACIAGSLRTYRRTAPASSVEQGKADRVINGDAWRVGRQHRLDHQLRLDRYREIQAIAAEARRPRRLSTLERQIRDVRQWGAEVRR